MGRCPAAVETLRGQEENRRAGVPPRVLSKQGLTTKARRHQRGLVSRCFVSLW